MAVVTIIGGHGKVALLAAPLLVAAGHEVRSVIRNADQSDTVAATGATPVVADVENLEVPGLIDLLQGSDAVVWSAGAGGGNEARTWAVDRDAAIRSMDATQQAGIDRYVMVSFFGSRLVDGEFPGVAKGEKMYPYSNAKAQADEYLRTQTALTWTVLGPSGLTLEEPTGRVTVNPEDLTRASSVPSVSRANVAAVVAAVLEEPASYRRTLDFHDGETPIAEAVTQGR